MNGLGLKFMRVDLFLSYKAKNRISSKRQSQMVKQRKGTTKQGRANFVHGGSKS